MPAAPIAWGHGVLDDGIMAVALTHLPTLFLLALAVLATTSTRGDTRRVGDPGSDARL